MRLTMGKFAAFRPRILIPFIKKIFRCHRRIHFVVVIIPISIEAKKEIRDGKVLHYNSTG